MWLGTFGLFHALLVPHGYGMFGRSWVAGIYYAAAAALGLAVFRRERTGVRPGQGPLWAPALVLLLTLGGTAATYAWANVHLTPAPGVLARCRDLQLGLIRMDGVYLALKLPELCFQQALIWVLVRRLQATGLDGWKLIGAFALTFGGIHLPILALKGLAGLPFILAAASASLVFVPLITRFRAGVGYSYSVHLSAYVLAGIVLRLMT